MKNNSTFKNLLRCNKRLNVKSMSYFAGVGLALGTGIGVAFGNIAIGAAIGNVIGASVSLLFPSKKI